MENTSGLADDAQVRERLFDGFRTEIISIAVGPEVAADAGVGDPASTAGDTVGGAAGQDTDEPAGEATEASADSIARDQAIEAVLLDVFDSPLYGAVFSAALTQSQQQIVRAAELPSEALLRDKGAITFDMRGLYPAIYERLAADARTAEITQTAVPESFGVFPVADRETTVDAAWSLVRKGPDLRALTLVGAVVCFAAALALADRRPATALQFGAGMVGLGIVVIVVIYLIRFMVPLLAGSGSSGSVVSVYATVIAPLVGTMTRVVIIGALVAAAGWIARLIWPDEWVYSSVSDERGVRSIMRRRGEPQVEPQAPPVAAAAPVAYPGYGVPYGYPGPWAQTYPGPPYPPGYVSPYPPGPYAVPAHQYYGPVGQPTVPVIPVVIDAKSTLVNDLVPPPAPPLTPGTDSDELPSDAAQMVPRVVARIDPDGVMDDGADPDGVTDDGSPVQGPDVDDAEGDNVAVADPGDAEGDQVAAADHDHGP